METFCVGVGCLVRDMLRTKTYDEDFCVAVVLGAKRGFSPQDADVGQGIDLLRFGMRLSVRLSKKMHTLKVASTSACVRT